MKPRKKGKRYFSEKLDNKYSISYSIYKTFDILYQTKLKI